MGSNKNGFKKERFILSVDVGTTSIRCHVYDKAANIRGSCTTKVIISGYSNYAICTQLLLCNSSMNRVTFGDFDVDNILPGYTSVSKGGIRGDKPRCNMERFYRRGQRGCARYGCSISYLNHLQTG